jgi:glutamate synthase domain-containing protein 1
MKLKNICQFSDSDRQTRIPSGCGIIGIFNRDRKRISGSDVALALCTMRERGNGLGSGYAAYGIYPELAESWCLHLLFGSDNGKNQTEQYLKTRFSLHQAEPIPTRTVRSLKHPPILWRYFVTPKEAIWQNELPGQDEKDYVASAFMWINQNIPDAFVMSSGKNMGIFKGVGQPDDIADFYRLEEYSGYLWTGHNRFPTNSVGWWGGAHPFGLLDWSVVHNGEISSYGVNRRYLENFGYFCTLFTDTEVIAYLFDLLVRKQRLPLEIVGKIIAAPFWSKIELLPASEQETARLLRVAYGSALMNGPFGVIVACSKFMLGITDRIKLRPLVAAEKGKTLYLASEQSAIFAVEGNPDRVWTPRAGEVTGGFLEEENG